MEYNTKSEKRLSAVIWTTIYIFVVSIYIEASSTLKPTHVESTKMSKKDNNFVDKIDLVWL